LLSPKRIGERHMAVITLSRQLGSHGEEIAARVAQALGLRLVDAVTINRAAHEAGVPQMALAEFERETQRGLANQMLKALRTMPSLSSVGELGTVAPDLSSLTLPFVGFFSPTVPPLSASLEGYVRMVDLVIRGLAQEGNVLIVGRGGQVVLRKHPGALHVQIVAPLAYRVEMVMARQGLSKRDAQNRVRTSDRARFDYVRRYHDVDWLDPTLYSLTINTGRLSVDGAVNLIMATQQAIEHSSGRNDEDEQQDSKEP
jgi:cytidylate kinase